MGRPLERAVPRQVGWNFAAAPRCRAGEHRNDATTYDQDVAGMRIARPLLLVTTPIGLIGGLREAWRFHWWLAVLMAVLIGVLGLFFWWTLRRIQQDASGDHRRG